MGVNDLENIDFGLSILLKSKTAITLTTPNLFLNPTSQDRTTFECISSFAEPMARTKKDGSKIDSLYIYTI